MKRIFSKLLGGALLFGLTMSLTSCEDILGHWEKPSPNPITPGGGTPVTPEEIIYAFSLRNMADDADVVATTLTVKDQDNQTIATATSDGKYTIRKDDLGGALELWLEATTSDNKLYIARATLEELPAIAEAGKLKMATVGDVIKDDGKFYAAGTSGAVAMIAYLGDGSDCDHGLAIQLNASPASMDWSAACSYSSYPSITGNLGTWRLPSKADWQNMFVGCAKSGDAGVSDNMNPIAGFKEKIGATGITWLSFFYWSSLGSGSFACYVLVNLNGSNAKAVFSNVHVSNTERVLGCLAF